MIGLNSICLLGFGEVGQILATDLSQSTSCHIKAFDVLFDDESSTPAQNVTRLSAVEACESARSAAIGCELIISVVTAGEVQLAAQSVADTIEEGACFLDMNSVSPRTKLEVAGIIEAAGGRFVEAAVMSPIAPRRLASPILLGGPHAESFLEYATQLGFAGAAVFSTRIGSASATKMCRSVVIKGMEALLGESLVAARHYGVEEEVLNSLSNLLQVDDWNERAHYMISRSIEHGERRAAEMREAAKTVGDAGVDPWMSTASVLRQEWASGFKTALETEGLSEMLDSILAGQRSSGRSLSGENSPDESSSGKNPSAEKKSLENR